MAAMVAYLRALCSKGRNLGEQMAAGTAVRVAGHPGRTESCDVGQAEALLSEQQCESQLEMPSDGASEI